jgi:hypothetical protein
VEPFDIIKSSVEAHGGLASWKQLKTLSFTKKTVLYNEDGSIKKTTTQEQAFSFDKSSSGTIDAMIDTTAYRLEKGNLLVKLGDRYYSLENSELERKKKLVNSALYVVSQPFQLMESDATFERKPDTLIGDKKVFSVRVKYPGESADSDQWTYYFDQDSYKVVGCKVKHNNRVSVIENTSYDTKTNFVFNATRKSTIMNGDKPKFVIAQYEYSNYKVAFD